jgi:uncharacterized phage infection (PIP) family protein YhgE
MSIMTSTSAPSDTPTAAVLAVTDGQKRVLEIPPLPGKREKVVQNASATLVNKYAPQVLQAEETIKKFGLTIEVSRLRDRLARSALSDLQRLLLATAGVPELLFNEAISQQVEEEEQAGSPVKDKSVQSIGEQIQQASKTLEQSLSAINESTEEFRKSTEAIVSSLGKVASAIDELDDDAVKDPPKDPPTDPPKPVGPSRSGAKPAGPRTSKGDSPTRTSSTPQQTGKSTS